MCFEKSPISVKTQQPSLFSAGYEIRSTFLSKIEKQIAHEKNSMTDIAIVNIFFESLMVIYTDFHSVDIYLLSTTIAQFTSFSII